tara:strand:+ start:12536 stop:12802 length:267 start_codon:yes stop_codon:yes gene_type:complete
MDSVYIKRLLIEAFFVGLCVVIFGSLTGFLISKSKLYPMPKLSDDCSLYNTYYIMEFTLFMTGVLIHLFCELVGINSWYVKNGAVLMK